MHTILGELNPNLVDVPISLNYYLEWFLDRVLKKQKVTFTYRKLNQ